MKNKCDVAKDLMPLCIDGVASEESQQYVDEHVAQCRACELIYGEMRNALPQMTAEKENAALEKAAKAIHTKRTIRALWAVIMGMAALMIALLANAGTVAEFIDDTWYQLRYVGPNDELRFEAYNVELEWHPYSTVVFTIESSPSNNRPFIPEFQLRYDELTGEAYLQLRVYASDEEEPPEEEELSDEGSAFDFLYYSDVYGYEYSHMYYQNNTIRYSYPVDRSKGRWEYVPITHIELVFGEEKVLLWKNGDGLPASCHAGQLTAGTEPIPTATPTPTPRWSYYVTPAPTPVGTPAPTRTVKPALPPHKR